MMFVAVEGIDGAGKTTIVELLNDHFLTVGREVVQCGHENDPRIRSILGQIRKQKSSPVLIALAFALDYALQEQTLIKPALAKNKIILSDRCILSSIVYNRAYGMDPRWSEQVFENFLWPTFTFILDIDPEIAVSRKPEDVDPLARAYDRNIVPFLTQVRQLYLDYADKYGLVVMNAANSPNEILHSILAYTR